MTKRKTKNEYDVSAHMVFPYNAKIRDVFFSKQKSSSYNVYKDDVLLQRNAEKVQKDVFNKILKDKKYIIEKKISYIYEPRKIINGVHVVVTRIKEGKKTLELLILVRSLDMRNVISNCDKVAEFVEMKTGYVVEDEAKLWTRQELC